MLNNRPLKLVEKYKIWYSISAAIALVGIVFMIIFACIGQGALNLGIDFTGGTKLDITIGSLMKENKQAVTELVTKDLKDLGVTDSNAVQYIDNDKGLSITFRLPKDADVDAFNTHFTDKDAEGSLHYKLMQSLHSMDASYSEEQLKVTYSTITATASESLIRTTILSLVVAVFLILIYITIRFEMLSGFIAVLALVHDTLLTICIMAVFRVPVNASFIAALITIIGYSINATIVIFDRIRENTKKLSLKQFPAKDIANLSIKETMTRSINTTITTLFTIVVLACFPIPDIQVFALPIIVGLLAGTFSSVFLAGTTWALIKDRRSAKKAKSDYLLAKEK